MDLIRPFDARDALIPVLADVFAIVTTNCPVGYDKEYDGRLAVSITRRVLLPGWTPVRKERNEFRAAKAVRGNIAATQTVNPEIFKRLRLLIFIVGIISKIPLRFKGISGTVSAKSAYKKNPQIGDFF